MTKTVEEWLNEWLEVYIKPCRRENTYLCYKYIIKLIIKENPEFSTINLSNVTEMGLQKMVNGLSGTHSKSTLKKVCGLLKRAYEVGIRNHFCEFNPAQYLTLPDASEKDVRALTREEQKRVEAAAQTDALGHVAIFFLDTGLRAGELINLKWDDYNVDRREIYIRNSKTKAGLRTVPLLPEAIDIISNQPHYGAYIFTSSTHNPITKTVLKRAYMRIRKAADIPFLTNHVYRHSFATRMVEHQADYKALSIILGHTNVAFTINKYTNAETAFLHEQIELLNSVKK